MGVGVGLMRVLEFSPLARAILIKLHLSFVQIFGQKSRLPLGQDEVGAARRSDEELPQTACARLEPKAHGPSSARRKSSKDDDEEEEEKDLPQLGPVARQMFGVRLCRLQIDKNNRASCLSSVILVYCKSPRVRLLRGFGL